MKQIEKRDLLEPQGRDERIDALLRMVEEGESFEIVDQGKIIALFEPPQSREQANEEDDDEENDGVPAWEELKRIAKELDPYWPEDVDAVEAVRDVRRDL